MNNQTIKYYLKIKQKYVNQKKRKRISKKIKILLKKDEDENERITYEVYNKEEKWKIQRHNKNIINGINRGRITYRV